MNLVNQKLEKIIKNNERRSHYTLIRVVLSVVVLGIMATSCSNENDSSETENQLEDTLEVQRSAEIDEIDSVLADLIIESY